MRFLVIGLGSIGGRHARNLMALGHEVIGYDLGQISPFLGITDISDLSLARDIDGCIIATPTPQHFEDLHYAIEHGWKNILVEKPIADSPSERLTADLQYATEVGINVVMGNNLRFHPSCRLTRRYINDGLIGNAIWAHIAAAQFNAKPDYLRDGVTLNWGAHEIDLALWLLGPAQVTAASINNRDTIADICLVHESGCRSVIHLDYVTDPEMRQAVVIGDGGRLIAHLPGRYVALQRGNTGQPPEQQQGSFDEDYKNEMIAFVNTCQGKPWLGATAQDGIETLKIIDTARKIAADNRLCPAA